MNEITINLSTSDSLVLSSSEDLTISEIKELVSMYVSLDIATREKARYYLAGMQGGLALNKKNNG